MTKLEKITAVKNLYHTTKGSFTIPDNCPYDGWEGELYENGAYLFTQNGGGEYTTYDDMEETILDTILNEAKFEK